VLAKDQRKFIFKKTKYSEMTYFINRINKSFLEVKNTPSEILHEFVQYTSLIVFCNA
jgi:hypothetical protein